MTEAIGSVFYAKVHVSFALKNRYFEQSDCYLSSTMAVIAENNSHYGLL